jgi:hypothetical protein
MDLFQLFLLVEAKKPEKASACPEADEEPPKEVTSQQSAAWICLVGGSIKNNNK